MFSLNRQSLSQEQLVETKKVLFLKGLSFHSFLEYVFLLVASHDTRIEEIIEEALAARATKNNKATTEEFLYKLIQDGRTKKNGV